jgi:hypothetical protein
MTSSSMSRTGRRDGVQQVALLVGGAVAVLGLAAGVGAFGGTPIGEIGDGDLAPDASLVVPAGVAFSIWTPIYAGLAGVALWQARPGQRDLGRLRAVGWPLLVSMLANAAWILAAQAQAYVLTVVVIVVILASLVLTYAGLLGSAPRSRTERVLLDGTVGLYLGWVSVATIANVSTTLVEAGYGDLVPGRTVWAVTMLAVAGALGAAVTLRGGGRLAFPAAVTWALVWVVVARLDAGPDRSVPAAVVAAVAAVAVVTAAVRGRRARR